MRMTDEQRKFAEDNIKLVYYYMSKENVDKEKYESMLMETYCRAILKYDENKGAFVNLLYRMFDNEIRRAYNYEHREKRTAAVGETIFSLDELYSDSDGYVVPKHEMYGGQFQKISDIDIVDICDRIIKRLEERGDTSKRGLTSKVIFELLIAGYSQMDIAKKAKCKPQYISYKVNRIIKPIVRQELEGC